VQPIAIEPDVEGFMCALARATCLGILRTESDRSEMNAETIVDKLNATIVAVMRDAPTTRRLVVVGKDPSHVHAGESVSSHCTSRK
jgi:hypothetical protein